MNPQMGQTVLLVGLGNIGSFLAGLLARNPVVTRLVLVDPDVVEQKNVCAQFFDEADVGMAKVDAVAATLRGLRPDLELVVVRGEVEDLPVGWFRCLVVLALDSNGPRRVAAQRTFRMGGRLVDCAVNGEAGLARVTELGADPEAGCLECAWSPETYEHLQDHRGCGTVPPTNAPASLGALAASLGAIRIREAARQGAPSETVEIVSTGAESCRSVIPRNPDCRFDHGPIGLEPGCEVDFGQSLGSFLDAHQVDVFDLPGFDWARRVRCECCGAEQGTLHVARGAVRDRCTACGGGMVRVAFHTVPALERDALSRDELTRTLAEVGLEPGDVVVPVPSRRGILLGDPHPVVTRFQNEPARMS